MTLFSMTGFAHAEGTWNDYRWTWEVKSVNSKGLDARIRLPQGFEAVEAAARKVIAKALSRGHVNAALQLERDGGDTTITVNQAALDVLIEAAGTAAKKHGLKKPRAEALMSLRGVIEVTDPLLQDDERKALETTILATLDDVLKDLIAARAGEGEALKRLLDEQINTIQTLTDKARTCASQQPDAIKTRLHTQIADLLQGSTVPLDDDRIAQEAAFLAVKADVREELDRLDAHVAAARELITEGSPMGRKLDFLSQEFSREANTLCSKAADAEMSAIGLELKAIIDQMREQVQNIE